MATKMLIMMGLCLWMAASADGRWWGYSDPCSPNPCQNGGTCYRWFYYYHWCSCPDYYEGYNCENEIGPTCNVGNPCTAAHIAAEEFYHAHVDPSKFLQCDAWGSCFEMSCQPGLVWDQSAHICNWP